MIVWVRGEFFLKDNLAKDGALSLFAPRQLHPAQAAECGNLVTANQAINTNRNGYFSKQLAKGQTHVKIQSETQVRGQSIHPQLQRRLKNVQLGRCELPCLSLVRVSAGLLAQLNFLLTSTGTRP